MEEGSSRRVFVFSLGCKLNQAEKERLERKLSERGFSISSPADIYIVLTCTVTHIADRKSRNLIRSLKREGAFVIATGCYAERSPNELYGAGADEVYGNHMKEDIPDILAGKFGEGEPSGYVRRRTRLFIKVQEGCPFSCSYCIVPKVRGRGKDLDLESIAREVKDAPEVVLTWTCPSDPVKILKFFLERTKVPRIRLSSLLPHQITPHLIELLRHERVCPHIHLPLQSGSDKVLRLMRRPYDIDMYEEKFNELLKVPDMAITTDVIAGFPGEDEGDFMRTLELVKRLPFYKIHVFPFSPRPGTDAFNMRGVDEVEKRRRVSELLRIGKEKEREFRRRYIGKVLPVLIEEKDGSLKGISHNYIKVLLNEGEKGEIINVRIKGEEGEMLLGERENGR